MLNMDLSVLILIIAIIIIFFLTGSNSNNEKVFDEPFTAFNDPKMYSNSCKKLVKEKATVSKLLVDDGCDGLPTEDLKLSNREAINKKVSCKNLTSKKIMLDTEQPSWCDRVGQLEKSGIVSAGSPDMVPITPNPEGPGYIENQYMTNFGSLLPNDKKDRYISFSNMTDPVVTNKYSIV
jgi:hypothetical protein